MSLRALALATVLGLPLCGEEGVRLAGAKAEGGTKVRLAGVSVGAGYSHGWPGWYGYGAGWYRPGWGWASPWGPYDPYWYSPWIYPTLYGNAVRRETMGEVKFDLKDRDATVYVENALAGTVSSLKSMHLDPGVYHIELRDASDRSWQKKVYVLSGRVLRLRPTFQ